MVKNKKKLYECKVEGCTNKQPILSKGMCDFHYQKEKGGLKKTQRKSDTDLDIFFNNQIKLLQKIPYSEHSGTRITKVDKKNIAHLLPKRYFSSVKDNNLNVIWLTWGEHSFFDNLLDKFDFKRLEQEFELGWMVAVSRLKQVLPLIPDEEKNNYYKKIKTYIDTKHGSKTEKD